MGGQGRPFKRTANSLCRISKTVKILTCTTKYQPSKIKIAVGCKFTNAEYMQVNLVLDYIGKLEEVDTSNAPDVIWFESI